MKAIVYESGGVEMLGISQVPDPVAGPGEVVVRVKACAMNHADVWGHKSEGPRFGGPRILGRDVAGVIEEVGEGVACWAKGDPVVVAPGVSCNVCFHCQHGQHADCPEYGMLGAKVDGGYAELMKVSAMSVYRGKARESQPRSGCDEFSSRMGIASLAVPAGKGTRGEPVDFLLW